MVEDLFIKCLGTHGTSYTYNDILLRSNTLQKHKFSTSNNNQNNSDDDKKNYLCVVYRIICLTPIPTLNHLNCQLTKIT